MFLFVVAAAAVVVLLFLGDVNLTLNRGSHCILDSNFIVRQLFKDTY